LNATSISVKGNSQLSEKQVVECSKLNVGENILSMNLSAAKKRLLSHPMISSVIFERDFPSGVTIVIKENVPIAILDIGRTFAINAHGEIFIETSLADAKRMPLIVGFTPSDINADGKIHIQPFVEVLNLLHIGLRPNSLLPVNSIKKIHVDKQTGLTVNTSGRIKKIKLGYGNYPKKIDRLKTIFNFLNDRKDLNKFVSVDLNNLKRIVLKPS
jgi:cell division protein FtsQ